MCGIFGIVSNSPRQPGDLPILAHHAEQRGRDSSGLVVGDVQPLVRLNVTCIAEEDGVRQQGGFGGGGRVPYDFLLDEERYLRFTRTAAEQALRNLHAADAPAGSMMGIRPRRLETVRKRHPSSCRACSTRTAARRSTKSSHSSAF